MSFVHGLLAAALLAVAPSFFAGPAHVGERVTYRVSTTMGAPQATPNVSTLVITWTTGARLFARLSTSLPGAAVAVARNGDGTLSVAPNPSNPITGSIETLLGQLNFPGLLAARLNGSEHAQTTLSVAPPASTAQATPAPVIVPLDLSLVSSSASATLIAEGNTDQNASSRSARGGSGGGRPGGSMGGWHSSGSGRSRNGSTVNRPSIDIAAEAVFDQSGSLEHATYRETITTSSSNGSQTVEHTITIDRVSGGP